MIPHKTLSYLNRAAAILLSFTLMLPAPAYAMRTRGTKLVPSVEAELRSELRALGIETRAGRTAPQTAFRSEVREEDYFDLRSKEITDYANENDGGLPADRLDIIREHRLDDIDFVLDKLPSEEKVELWALALDYLRVLAANGQKIMITIPAAGLAARMSKGFLAPFFINAMHVSPDKFINTEKLTPDDWKIIDAQFNGDWKAYVRSLTVAFKEIGEKGKEELVPASEQDMANHMVLDRLFHEDRALLPADDETQLTEVTFWNAKIANDFFESLGLGRLVVVSALKNEKFYPNFVRYAFLNSTQLGVKMHFKNTKTGQEIRPDAQHLASLSERELQSLLNDVDIDHDNPENEILVYNQPLKPVTGAPRSVVEAMWKEDLSKAATAEKMFAAIQAGHELDQPAVKLTDDTKPKLKEKADELLKSRYFLGSEQAYQYALKRSDELGGKAIRNPKAMRPAGHIWAHLSRFMANVGSRKEPLLLSMIRRKVALDFLHNADNGALADEYFMLILGKMLKDGAIVALEDSQKPPTERGSGGGANVWVRDPKGKHQIHPIDDEGKPLPHTVSATLRQAEFALIKDSTGKDKKTGKPFSPLYNSKGEAKLNQKSMLVNNATVTAFMPVMDSEGHLSGRDAYSALVGQYSLEEAIHAGLRGDYGPLEGLAPLMQSRMTRFLSKKAIKDPFVTNPGPYDLIAVIPEEGVAWDVQLGDGVLDNLLVALTSSVADYQARTATALQSRFNPVKDRGYGAYKAGVDSKREQVAGIKEGRIFSDEFRQFSRNVLTNRVGLRFGNIPVDLKTNKELDAIAPGYDMDANDRWNLIVSRHIFDLAQTRHLVPSGAKFSDYELVGDRTRGIELVHKNAASPRSEVRVTSMDPIMDILERAAAEGGFFSGLEHDKRELDRKRRSTVHLISGARIELSRLHLTQKLHGAAGEAWGMEIYWNKRDGNPTKIEWDSREGYLTLRGKLSEFSAPIPEPIRIPSKENPIRALVLHPALNGQVAPYEVLLDLQTPQAITKSIVLGDVFKISFTPRSEVRSLPVAMSTLSYLPSSVSDKNKRQVQYSQPIKKLMNVRTGDARKRRSEVRAGNLDNSSFAALLADTLRIGESTRSLASYETTSSFSVTRLHHPWVFSKTAVNPAEVDVTLTYAGKDIPTGFSDAEHLNYSPKAHIVDPHLQDPQFRPVLQAFAQRFIEKFGDFYDWNGEVSYSGSDNTSGSWTVAFKRKSSTGAQALGRKTTISRSEVRMIGRTAVHSPQTTVSNQQNMDRGPWTMDHRLSTSSTIQSSPPGFHSFDLPETLFPAADATTTLKVRSGFGSRVHAAVFVPPDVWKDWLPVVDMTFGGKSTPVVAIASTPAEIRAIKAYNLSLPANHPQILFAESIQDAVRVVHEWFEKQGRHLDLNRVFALVGSETTVTADLIRALGGSKDNLIRTTPGMFQQAATELGITSLLNRFRAELRSATSA